MTDEGRTGGASVTVRADPALLWSMVADITRMGEWSPENRGGEWLDGATGAVVGARFKGHNRRGRSRWSTTCEVTEAEPGRSFAFRTGSSKTLWRYRFEPAEGGTLVTESFEMEKPLGVFSRWLTRVTTGVTDRRGDMEEGVRTTLARLKAAAEDATATGA
ncbi:MAG: SRPBCC family protein [Actinomycetes bacterium]